MSDKKTKSIEKLPKTHVADNRENPQDNSFFSAENLRSLGMLALIIIVLRSMVISPYHVPTPSMEPTIKVGDRLLANKLAYGLKFSVPFTQIDFNFVEWSSPARGDIIVFRYPRDPSTDYVKRVVAIGGDKVSIVNDILYINGNAVPRKEHNFDREILKDIQDNAANKDLFVETLDGHDFFIMQLQPASRQFFRSNWPGEGREFVVPEDSVFVMGDNRDNSQDSRVWHEVPISYIRGKATFVIWSSYTAPDDSWPTLRLDRFGYPL